MPVTAMTPGGTTYETTQLNIESLWTGGSFADPVSTYYPTFTHYPLSSFLIFCAYAILQPCLNDLLLISQLLDIQRW